MSAVSGFGSMSQVSQLYQSSIYNSKPKDTKKSEATASDPSAAMKLRQNQRAESASSIQDGVKLSEGAQKVLDELKEKYQNMDFFVANNATDEEAKDIMSRSNKEYSVLFDAETLEKMAQDEDTKNEYMGKIEDATGQLKDISEKLKDSGAEVTNIGVKFDKDGTAKFFADIKKSNENYAKKTQEAKEAAKKEAERAEKAKVKKDKEAERLEGDDDDDKTVKDEDKIAPGYEKRASIQADTAEELIEQIKGFDWSNVQATRIPQMGGKFDLSI